MFYRNARVVLNDHWPDMRDKGFVSNRIFDVLACGVPLISDSVVGVPSELDANLIYFDETLSIADSILRARSEGVLEKTERFKTALVVHKLHSFDARVGEMLTILQL